MRIMHILSSNKFSGAENVVCQIINMYKSDDNIEMVYCSPDGPIKDSLLRENITFIPLKKMTVKDVKKAIKIYNPDIIHAHDMRASFIAALSCGKKKLISHIHNNALDARKISVKSILYMVAAKKSSQIIWVSKSSLDGYFFNKKFKNKSSIMYNVIDVEKLYKKMEEDICDYDYDVIYLGRLTYPKNPDRLIELLSMIKKEINDVKVAIVGTGDLEEKTKQKVLEKGLSRNVTFMGFQKNPLKVLWNSKVMVLTSIWEGTPMCALEAIALDVPIVSTPTDGLIELIKNDSLGYLSDDNDVLSQRCIEIIKNSNKKNLEYSKAKNILEGKKSLDNYKLMLLKIYGE